jgi:hypothetical protein
VSFLTAAARGALSSEAAASGMAVTQRVGAST